VICLALVIISVLASAVGLVRRIQAERSARAVDITLDYPEVQALADRAGLPMTLALTQLRTAGATAVALPEETLTTLQDDGQITLTGNAEHPAGAPSFLILPSSPASARFILQGLRRNFPAQQIHELDGGRLLLAGRQDAVNELGLGLSPEKVATITDAGLRVTPRLRGEDGRTPGTLSAAISAVALALPPPTGQTARGIVIFDGTSTPGYRALIPNLANALTAAGLTYGCIEFGKQKGDVNLGAKLKGQFVRVHSISLEELSTMSDAEAIQRFALAVKDRNIRVLYVHFPPMASDDPLLSARRYVAALATEIRGMHGMGMTVSPSIRAHPFTAITVPSWLKLLLFAGAGASLLLWVVLLLPTTLPAAYVRAGYVLLILTVLGAAGAAVKLSSLGVKAFGLLAAIGFPLLALTWAYREVDRLVERPPLRVVLTALRALLIATGITLLGAALIAAMMGDTNYLVKVEQFAGVKVALSVPLLCFALLAVMDGVARPGETLAVYRDRCRARWQAFMGQPLYLWGAIIGVIALALVAIVLARSGNDSGVGVSGFELKSRAILDQWMIARPRTKEFAFGVPCLLFAMVAAAQRRRTLALALLLGAAIGQTDVLNTYCHAHTPVLLSLLRTFNGLWLGVLIGVLVLALFAPRALRPTVAPVDLLKS
jgi:hypothetical protein